MKFSKLSLLFLGLCACLYLTSCQKDSDDLLLGSDLQERRHVPADELGECFIVTVKLDYDTSDNDNTYGTGWNDYVSSQDQCQDRINQMVQTAINNGWGYMVPSNNCQASECYE